MEKLEKILEKIELLLPEMHQTNSQVSKASVGWHIEHSLLIINSSLKGLTLTDPSNYKSTFSFKKWLVISFGYIPKGKIKAPKLFIPFENPVEEHIIELLKSAKDRLKKIPGLPMNAYIEHPFLGHFNKKITLKFLKIHTHHHLKIINDILKSN